MTAVKQYTALAHSESKFTRGEKSGIPPPMLLPWRSLKHKKSGTHVGDVSHEAGRAQGRRTWRGGRRKSVTHRTRRLLNADQPAYGKVPVRLLFASCLCEAHVSFPSVISPLVHL
jgi:hypothetical protein